MKRTLGFLLLAFALIQGATGCSYTEDRDVFKSTYMQPKSVYVLYKPSNETAWSYDIPPQHILVVERDAKDTGLPEWARMQQGYPTKLIWELYPIDATPSRWYEGHYNATPIEKGEVTLNGSALVIGSTVGKSIDPSQVPADRPIEQIEQDLPEPTAK